MDYKQLDKGGKKHTRQAFQKQAPNESVFWKNNWTREKGQQQMQCMVFKFYEILLLMEESTH